METIRAAYELWKSGGSRAALIRLLEESQVLIYGVCFEVLRHRHDAEDATQRVLLEIQRGLNGVADAEHYLRRLRLIAFRTALDTRRDRRRRVDRERKAADMNPSTPLSEDVREAIHEAMSALDEESRALVLEHFFEKATLDAMAARRGVSAAAIWKRIQGIKNRLREGLVLAGLASAASKAEACLESATLAAPTANLVTVATIGGGVMAAKASTAAVATIVASLTFALGLGGGLAIQAARAPDPQPGTTKIAEDSPLPPAAAPPGTKQVVQPAPSAPTEPPVSAPEDPSTLPREIWAQFSRPRFFKDQAAQEEVLPKLDLLGPGHAAFFIEKFRDPGLDHEAKKRAVRLAVTCGGPDAAALLLELVQGGPDQEARDYRLGTYPILEGQSWGGLPEIPISGALRDAAMHLLISGSGWDRSMALSLLAFGEPDHWKPLVMDAARNDSHSLMRQQAVGLIVLRGDPAFLQFLRDHKESICKMAPDPKYGSQAGDLAARDQERLGRVVDQAIAELEGKLKK